MSTSEKSDWSVVGLAHKFGLAWEKCGGTVAEANAFAQRVDILRGVIGVLRGTHEIRPRFPTWHTVRRGVYKTLPAYLAALAAKKYSVEELVVPMLSSVVWAQEEGEEELVRGTGRDFGLENAYTIDELTVAAARFELYRLDADVAAGLREQYDDQPIGRGMICAMDPIGDKVGNLGVFSVERTASAVFLARYGARPEYKFDPDRTVWIFTRRKRRAQS